MLVNGKEVNILENVEYIVRGVLYKRVVYSSKINGKIKRETFRLSK